MKKILTTLFAGDAEYKRTRCFRLLGEVHTAELHIAQLTQKLGGIDHTVDWNGYANCRQAIEDWTVERDRLLAAVEKLK